jgi:hypothetical protein
MALESRSFRREHFRKWLHRRGNKRIRLLHHLPRLVNKINLEGAPRAAKVLVLSSAEKNGATCWSTAKAGVPADEPPPTRKLGVATARTSGGVPRFF